MNDKNYGVTFRRFPPPYGELRGVLVSAESEEEACSYVLRRLMANGTASKVQSIVAAYLGDEDTATYAEQHHRWSLGIVAGGGNVMYLPGDDDERNNED